MFKFFRKARVSQVIVLVYSNGRKFQGPQGLTFEGQKRAIQIKRGSISYDLLKKIIAAKLRLQPHQIISTLTYRFPTSQSTYTDLEILDSEDVDCMISASEKHSAGANVLELYVDIIDDVHSENIALSKDDDDDEYRSVKDEDGGGVPNDESSTSDAEVAGDSKGGSNVGENPQQAAGEEDSFPPPSSSTPQP